VPAAVGGTVAGALAAAVVSLVGVLLASGVFVDERQQEGTLVVLLVGGAVLGAAAGRATALRLTGHAVTAPFVTAASGLLAVLGATSLLGAVVPAEVMNAYGLLLLPVTLVLSLAGAAAAGEVLAGRLAR
jgi:hypothetical protein